MAAVIRALLNVKATGLGVTKVTIWSDSKIVVQGYNKGKVHTLQSPLVTDWEDLWDQAEAISQRGTPIYIRKVKAHTSDEAVASREHQNGNWQADRFADMGAQACQLT
eukprot:1469462-Karenia_brevis.AAC.1